MEALAAVLEAGRDLADLASTIVKALAQGKTVRVEDVLPTSLQTTLKRQVADAKAAIKFSSTR